MGVGGIVALVRTITVIGAQTIAVIPVIVHDNDLD